MTVVSIMSINETPYSYNHTIVCPLPLQTIDGASSTTQQLFYSGLDQEELTGGSVVSGQLLASMSTTTGEPICNYQDARESTKTWREINVLNPFDPIPFQSVDSKLNAETIDVLNRYNRFRVMSVEVDFHFFNTPDQGHDSGTRFHLPLIFGVNKYYVSQHRTNHPIQCWNYKGPSAATFNGKGFNVDDYLTWQSKDGQDVCVGGGWRVLSGGDAPLTIKWSRFAHYYDQSKFDREWADILYNNTNRITVAPGSSTWQANSGDSTSDAYIAQCPYNRWNVNVPTAITNYGEQPIYLQPYGLAPGHYVDGTSEHPSIKIAYRAVVKYHVEFTEPQIDDRWKGKVNLTMSEARPHVELENPDNEIFDQHDAGGINATFGMVKAGETAAEENVRKEDDPAAP